MTPSATIRPLNGTFFVPVSLATNVLAGAVVAARVVAGVAGAVVGALDADPDRTRRRFVLAKCLGRDELGRGFRSGERAERDVLRTRSGLGNHQEYQDREGPFHPEQTLGSV